MRKACVIGWPIAHSRSPLIHGYWLKRLRIAGSYERVPVEPGKAGEFIANLERDGYAGCNVTLPHKEAAFAAVRVADEATERLGVVNTVYLSEGVTWGTSTDGVGFLSSVRAGAPGWRPEGKHVTLIGAGGAARAIAGALIAESAAEIAVANRTPERAQVLRRSFGPRIKPIMFKHAADTLSATDMLVNTTSLGMEGQPPLEIDLSRLAPGTVVADIVYAPLETELIRQARAHGHTAVPGLGMLLHQAVKGFSLWFGVTPEVTDELYDLVAADLANPGAAP